MNLLKKLGLAFSAIAFCMSLSVAATYAQPGKAKYEGNRGKHKGWTKGKHKGWEKRDARWDKRNNRWDQRNDRSYSRGRLSEQELTRLERQRARLSRTSDRYNRDGSINNREQRRLIQKASRYNQRYRRAVRN